MSEENETSVGITNIVKAILEVADELGKPAHDVTRVDLINNSDITDYQIKKYGNFSHIKNAHFPYPDKDLAQVVKQKDVSSYVSKLENIVGRQLLNEDSMSQALQNIKPVTIAPYKSPKKEKIKRAINVILSDLHIGSDINASETGRLNFGKTEESRRLARITKEVIEYKIEHRNETELNVMLLGDVIQNQLHDQRDGAPLAEQFARAVSLISQAIAQFSAHYSKVNIYCNSGNHGRNTARHHGRAVNQKWDSVETQINYALKVACQNLKNVKFHIPLTPYVTYEVFGQKIFATHGDSVLSVGFPGKGLKTESLEKQINRINASLDDKHEYKVFIIGHVHVGSITHLGNGAVMVTNGAMVPADEYAVSIGMLENTCGQYMFESIENYPVGDTRFIKVSTKDDKDKSLDKIIKPWDNFDT